MGIMYSPFYFYHNICKDKELSEIVSTEALIRFLKSMPELMQQGEFVFRNNGGFPYWLRISLFKAPSYFSYQENDTDSERTNLLVVVATRDEIGQLLIQPLLDRISSWLNWQLIEVPHLQAP